jgi:hypothetical protein
VELDGKNREFAKEGKVADQHIVGTLTATNLPNIRVGLSNGQFWLEHCAD